MRCDAVIFGGGVAGLWLLNELRRQGRSALLLEAAALGAGQTVASQGIIHGGLKYTLQGLLTRSASNIAEMPAVWRGCLAGERSPNLSGTRLRSEHCFLWRTESLSSRLGMIGARVGLRVAPQNLKSGERPHVLCHCPGTVARMDEQVLSPPSLLAELAAPYADCVLQIDAEQGLTIDQLSPGNVSQIHLTDRQSGRQLLLQPEQVILTAGGGNPALRALCGLTSPAAQRRPLHMALLRGPLPWLNGHCVDGAKTRVTVTSEQLPDGRVVWQVGGQIAEDGVTMDAETLIARARREFTEVLPGLDLRDVEWATYRVDRAEPAVAGGKRPESCTWLAEGNVITAWPTKLVLAPVLAEQIAARIPARHELPTDALLNWPRPPVAAPPWETAAEWRRLPAGGTYRKSA